MSSRLAGGLAALAVLVLLVSAAPAFATELPSPNLYLATVAERLLDTPYLEGGHGPAGVDVPGFTRLVYHRAGVALPQDVARQAQRGVAVQRDELRRGDLVFDAALGHVGVYAGKAEVFTMPGPDAVVVRQAMDDWGSDLTFRRCRFAHGTRVVRLATRYLGVPYVWGGASPSGFDSSGLTMYVYALVGVPLTHGATDQQKTAMPVRLDRLRPGDLVFFGKRSYSHHVGIYVGAGRMIHAPHVGAVVRYDTIKGAWIGGRLLPAR